MYIISIKYITEIKCCFVHFDLYMENAESSETEPHEHTANDVASHLFYLLFFFNEIYFVLYIIVSNFLLFFFLLH
jgi:hypothetical protein